MSPALKRVPINVLGDSGLGRIASVDGPRETVSLNE